MMSEKPSEAMTTKEAAAYLGKAEGTVRNWKDKGIGPDWIRVGGSVRYTKDALDEFVRKRK